VVRRLIHRLGRRRILLPSHQWFCWLPVRRGRYTVITLGAASPISGYLIALNLTSGCSFYEFLASQRSAPRFLLLSQPSRVMWGSRTANLRHYSLSISYGRLPALSYMSSRNWSSCSALSKTVGPLETSSLGPLSSRSRRFCCSPSAQRYVTPSSTISMGFSSSHYACF
jgi:hypothetical protein